jgi:hypothetical protein
MGEFLGEIFGETAGSTSVGSNGNDLPTVTASQPFFATSNNQDVPTAIAGQSFVAASSEQYGNGTVVGSPISNFHVRPNDVLLGRGRYHPGNVDFRKRVATCFDEYEASKKQKQTRIARQIIQTIVNDGGRFLTKPPTKSDSWEEIDLDEARLKVAHTFRSVRKTRRKKG